MLLLAPAGSIRQTIEWYSCDIQSPLEHGLYLMCNEDRTDWALALWDTQVDPPRWRLPGYRTWEHAMWAHVPVCPKRKPV